MMKSFLLFQLHGPLASWGDIAVGGERPSASHPSRSAVLGLLAAAAGIRRDEEERHLGLERSFGMAVRLEAAGISLSDFHTAQVPTQAALKKRPSATRRDELLALDANPESASTILSNRTYRCDALCQIALWLRQEAELSLEQLKRFLERPCFVLHLGRKSCPPALPLQAQLVEAETLAEAFEKASFVSPQELLREVGIKDPPEPTGGRSAFLFWDGEDESGLEARETFVRRDAVLSRRRWQFGLRNEHRAAWEA